MIRLVLAFTLLWASFASAAQVPIELYSDRFIKSADTSHEKAQLIAQMNSFFPGPGTAHSSVVYVGPANAVASPTACWSLMACSSAVRGNRVVNVCDSTGGVDNGACKDVLSNASTGALVTATNVGTNNLTCPGSAFCTVKIWYEQLSPTLCTGGIPCDGTQNTVALRMVLSATGCPTNQAYCLTKSGSQSYQTPALTSTVSQPLTWSAVVNRTSGNLVGGIASGGTGGDAELFFTGTVSLVSVYAGGSFATATATDAAWHSLQGVLNGASSVTNVNGVDGTPANSGTAGLSTTGIILGTDAFAQHTVLSITEVLLYPIAFAAPGNSVTMCNNQFTRWGTSVSC